jgi:hypothetical protein
MTKPSDQVEGEGAGSEELHGGGLPDNERRDALKKIAKYSAYSAPALLALMKSAKAAPSSVEFDL